MFFVILQNSKVKKQTEKVDFLLQTSALIGVWLIQKIQYNGKNDSLRHMQLWNPRRVHLVIDLVHEHGLQFYVKHKWMLLIWR